jgi:hypothetical protein
VDDAGALRWQGKLPNPEKERELATYQLDAGAVAPGKYAVLVRLLSGTYFYELNLRALRGHPEK